MYKIDSLRKRTTQRSCRLLGITRQAYYKHQRHHARKMNEGSLIIDKVEVLRSKHPKMGSKKLYHLLQEDMSEMGIKMGRDNFNNLLRAHNLLIRRRKTRIYTTNSYHHYHTYKNLIKDITLTRPNQLWVSDITYWKSHGVSYFIFLITDAYSKKIVGYEIGNNLEGKWAMKALCKAFSAHFPKNTSSDTTTSGLIHHSDRGSQYCAYGYTDMLKDNQVQISMTETGNPRDNAVAERINGIIKNEYMLNYQAKNLSQAREKLEQSVRLYNEERPHWGLQFRTPIFVHEMETVNPYQNLKLMSTQNSNKQ